MVYTKSIVLISVALLFVTAFSPTAWAVKPRPPLQLSLQQTELFGGESKLTMVAVANVDINHVTLSLELPPGLSLIEGKEDWEDTMKKGETKQVEWIVQSPNQAPKKVTGKAIVELNAGEKFFEQTTLTLNEAKKDTPLRTPSVKRKEGGKTILEFKGR